jgi:hypothetical protein
LNEQKKKLLYDKLSPIKQRQLDLASEKVASVWLTSRVYHLLNMDYFMNKERENPMMQYCLGTISG